MLPHRLLFVGIGADRYSHGIVQDLRESEHISFAAGVIDQGQDSLPFDLIVCHFSECLFANYKNRNDWMQAIDDDLYSAIKSAEGNLLRQMDRLIYEPSAFGQKVPFRGTFDDRRQLLFDHLRFWNYTLRAHRIDAVVFHNVPHQIFDSVIYHLCKALGIRTLMFNVAGAFRDTNFVSESIDELGLLDLGTRLKGAYSDWVDDDSRVFRDWRRVCAVIDNFVDAGPTQTKSYSLLQSLVNDGHVANASNGIAEISASIARRLRRLRTGGIGSLKIWRQKMTRLRDVKRTRSDELGSLSKLPLPTNFLYFPLHFQPEATTSAKGRHYVELFEAALSICQILPEGISLVIKEHPHQYQKLLPRQPLFLERFSSMPNTFVVDSAFNSIELRNKCLGVVTVSGSNGFEVLASGKPVIAFGAAPWREAPGVFTVGSKQDVQNALTELLIHPPTPRDAYIDFLTRLKNGTVMAELSDSRGERTDQEDYRMQTATRVNVTELIRNWLSKI